MLQLIVEFGVEFGSNFVLSYTIGFLCILFSIQVSANTDLGTIQCNECSYPQYQSAATNAVARAGSAEGQFTVDVFDFHNERMVGYLIVRTNEPGLPEFMYVNREPNNISLFNDVINAKHDVMSAMSTEIPEDIAPSVHRVLSSSTARNNVGDYITRNTSFRDSFFTMVSFTALLVTGTVDQVNLVVTIKFPDGSSAKYTVTGIESINEITYEYFPGSARDADNNALPDNPAQMSSGEYEFTRDEAFNNFLTLANEYGIPIIRSGEPLPTTCEPTAGGLRCFPTDIP